jgi:5-methyltetrahydropteroyltriglutamate--homocysteine methyltransferase
VLTQLPDDVRIGVGVINQKSSAIDSVDEIVARAATAINYFGVERVILNPDCGFATFADNPITPADVAEKKLISLVTAANRLRRRYRLPL